MPAQKRTQQQASILTLMPAKKTAVLGKHSFKFEHTCKQILPATIEIVLDLDLKTFSFNNGVTAVFKSVKHSGIQPPKTFNKRDGNGTFDKVTGLDLYVDADTSNADVINTLESLNAAIAREFESKLGGSDKYYGKEMARDGDDAGSKIVDFAFSNSELQIVARHPDSKPGFKGPTEISELKGQYLEAYPDVDQNIMNVQGENGEYLTHILKARAFYEKIYHLIQNRLPEPPLWQYASFDDKLISVACNVVGGKVWLNRDNLFIVKPNMFLDKIRVILGPESDNGDHARWSMRFFTSKISIEHHDFLEDQM